MRNNHGLKEAVENHNINGVQGWEGKNSKDGAFKG